MQALILTLAAFIVTGVALRRQTPTGSRPARQQQRQDVDGIAPHIERAAALLDQLRELDDLQTSLELCAPMERAQALRLEWVNHSGSTHSTRFWMDGTDTTGAVLAAAIREREALRASLLEEIRAAYLRECVTGTDTATGAGTPSGIVTETTREGGAV